MADDSTFLSRDSGVRFNAAQRATKAKFVQRADTYDDPHLQERGYFQEVTHPDAGTFPLSGPLWKLSGTDERPHRPAPGLGEHNSYVLEEVLGLSKAALQSLEREGVIGTVPLEGSDMGGVRRVQRGA